MLRTSFNRDWESRPRPNSYLEAIGRSADYVPVMLPHDAMIYRQRVDSPGGASTGYFPGGADEYRKSFFVPDNYRGQRVLLEFEAVYRDAKVYINGQLAGQWAYGYSNFVVRVDGFLLYGDTNTVRVESRDHEDSRWYSGAGMYRGVSLVIGNLAHITLDGIRVTTPDIDSDRAVVEIATEIRNDDIATRTLELRTEICNPRGAVVASDSGLVTALSGESSVLRQRIVVENPELWGVDSPSLYSVAASLMDGDLVVDKSETVFGVRALQLDPDQGLRINGQEVKLRGACIHHDNGVIGAATIARADERRVELLKAAGFNAIRSAHNPISKAMLDACDRIGMLVIDEAFDVWTSNKSTFDYSAQFLDWWERDIESMVVKDFNHPSVILYSIGNEIPETGTPVGAALGRKLAEKVRSIDNTRFVTNAINGMVSVMSEIKEAMAERFGGESDIGVNALMSQIGSYMNAIGASELVTERTRESFSVLDVAGMNYLDGRYELDKVLFPARTIVGTETFPTQIDINWSLVTANSHVIGDFTWTGWDYLGEAGLGRVVYSDEDGTTGVTAGFPQLAAGCGDIDITGHRRPASYYREIVFGLRAAPYIAVQRPENYARTNISGPWTWSDSISSWTWDVSEGSPIKIEVYSDADEVELILDGSSLGRHPTGRSHRYRTEFDTHYRAGELTAIASTDGIEVGRCTLRTAGNEVKFNVAVDRTDLTANAADLAYIAITLTDAQGILNNRVDQPITLEITGPGVLQGFGSANPSPIQQFTELTHTTFDGRALAVIRPTGPGDIQIKISSSGCEQQTIHLRVSAPKASPSEEASDPRPHDPDFTTVSFS